MDPVEIREATDADCREIQRVARAAWHATYDAAIGAERVRSVVDSWYDPDRLASDDVAPAERPLFVATKADAVVGFVEGVPDDADDRRFHLYRLYVHPDHQGRGIGTRLLERLERAAVARGRPLLELSVMAPNESAIAFYESRGFDRIGTEYDDRFDVETVRYERTIE